MLNSRATVNVTSILLAALISGLAAGLPIGYFARQLSGTSPTPNVATLQR